MTGRKIIALVHAALNDGRVYQGERQRFPHADEVLDPLDENRHTWTGCIDLDDENYVMVTAHHVRRGAVSDGE